MGNFIVGLFMVVLGCILILDGLVPQDIAHEIGLRWGEKTRQALGLPDNKECENGEKSKDES